MALFLLLKHFFCPAKLQSNADFAPQNHGEMQNLPRKITDPLFFAPQNHRDFILCPAELWSNADFALRNHEDIVSGPTNICKHDYFSFFLIFFGKLLFCIS